MKSEGNQLILSIRLMTFNHEDYILESLKGIDNQNTNFQFEVVYLFFQFQFLKDHFSLKYHPLNCIIRRNHIRNTLSNVINKCS